MLVNQGTSQLTWDPVIQRLKRAVIYKLNVFETWALEVLKHLAFECIATLAHATEQLLVTLFFGIGL